MRFGSLGRLAVVAACTLTSLALAPAPPASAAAPTVEGTVRDPNGQLLQGASVQAWLQGGSGMSFSPSASAIAGPLGQYTLSLPADGAYLVTAGMAPWSQVFPSGATSPTPADVMTFSSDTTTTVDLNLAIPGSLTGSVEQPGGGAIIGGSVSVSAISTGGPYKWFPMFMSQLSGSATTDGLGGFTINNLAPGSYRVSGGSSEQNGPFAYEMYDDAYTEATATPVVVPPGGTSAPIVIDLEVGGTVSGHISDGAGAPLSGYWVTLMGPNGEYGGAVAADANGDYSIHGITPGTYTAVTGSPLTYHPGTTNGAQATYVTVGLGDVITGIDVQMPAPARIEATILDATGTPISVTGSGYFFWGIAQCTQPSVPVETFSVCSPSPGTTPSVTHPADGVAIADGLAAGDYNIAGVIAFPITFSGYVPLTLLPGDVATCTFQIGAGGSCTVTHGTPEPDDDGVPGDVESGVPGGDGNGDTVPDAEQTNVASLPSPVSGGGYVTVAAPTGLDLSSVSVIDPASITATPPAGATVDNGVLAYTLNGVTTGTTVDVDVFLTTPTTANGYAKIQGNQWVPLPGSAFTKVSSTHFVLHLTDGGIGDEDGQANGTIVDPGAPITLDTTPPTITCPATPTVVLNAVGATLTAAVSDSGAGVAAGTVTVPVSTATLGTQQVTVNAADLAGNSATATCSYLVGVRIKHLQVDGEQSGRVEAEAGEMVKVEWRTVDAAGNAISTPVTTQLLTAATTCGADPTIIGPETTATLNGAGIKYTGNGWWEAKWKTDKTWRGCRRLVVATAGDSDGAKLRFEKH